MKAAVWTALVMCSASVGYAQSDSSPARVNPADAVTAPKADTPVAAVPVALDAETQRVLTMLKGSFASPAAGEQPALVLNSAPVSVAGLPGAVYFEIARADAISEPFRSGLFWVYRRRGDLHLRVFDLVGAGALKESLVGVYLAPDLFPALEMAAVQPNFDVMLREQGGGYAGETAAPVPTMRDGATEMTSKVRFSDASISFNDQGFDEQGKQVWGASSAEGVVFARATQPGASVTRSPEGLVVITLAAPPATEPKLVEGGEVVVHYTGWLTNGTRFDTSRQAGREPFRIRIPGGVIKGWNEGLKGIAKGERRRLIIPPALAYGDRGAGRGLIPPNSTLVFDIECMFVDNSNPAPPPTPPAPPPPQTPAGTPGGAENKPDGGQIGKPATNSAPEKPR